MNNETIFENEIKVRLKKLDQRQDPFDTLWPENCEGSRIALVIFVGPSPGGSKQGKRHEIKSSTNKPLWNQPYLEPLSWSRGFQVSFKPIVETIFGQPYDVAAKLIARFNLDWMPNPESDDVEVSSMREGCSHILPILVECKPKLVIPMDKKTFGILQDGFILDGYDIDPIVQDEVRVRIRDNDDHSSYHRDVTAVTAKKDDQSFLMINSFQHPARIFDEDYALRIGKAIRLTAVQIWNKMVVSFIID